jgi:hypothetical protein
MIGGWAGWKLGALHDITLAFLVSLAGTVLGLYAARWLLARLLD